MHALLFLMPLLLAPASLAGDNPIDRWARAVGGHDKVAAIKATYCEATAACNRLRVGGPLIVNSSIAAPRERRVMPSVRQFKAIKESQ